MALAYLQLLDKTESKCHFLMDTGTSSYFEFVIGKSAVDKNGTQFADDIQKKTGIKRTSVSNPLRTDSEIKLDISNFENDSRYIQLFTYRSADGRGVSFSKVVEVIPKLFVRNNNLGDLPNIQIPKFFSMSASYQAPGRVSQAFSEGKMSEAMWFASLLPMVTKILPIATKVLGGLSGGGAAGGILGNILPMISGLLGGAAPPPAAPAGNGTSGNSAPAPAPGINLAELLKPETILAIKGLIDQFTQKEKMSGQKSVSEKVSPALLHLSPAIAPILEKMISPEAIASIGSNPQKLYAALADGIAHLSTNDIITIKKLLVQTNPSEYVKRKSDTNYSQPMFWQALLSMITPEMVNAIGDKQAKFFDKVVPKGDINQPVIKDMLNAISQYNLITHQPSAPQQAVAQSIGAFTNALCQVIPVVENSLSSDSLVNDTQDLVDNIQNQFLKFQEDIKKNMLKSMKEKIEEQVDNIDIKALSLQFSNSGRHENGLNIFNCNGKRSAAADTAAKAMTKLLPVAFANELKRTATAFNSKGNHKRQRYSSSDPAVALMLQKIDEAVQTARHTISFKHDDRFSLDISGAKTLSINGTQKVVYIAEKGIRFAVTVQSSKKESVVIPQCLIQVQIKCGDEKNILADKKFRLTNVQTGTVTDNLFFEADEIKNLPVNTDLLVCFTLAWKDKHQVKGTRKCHSIVITQGYLFDGLSTILKQGIPLNNITEHRDFWHKVWESKNSATRKKTNIDCKYYLQFDPEANQNNHIQTKTLVKKGKEVSDSEYETDDDFVKIKSGLQLSPRTLNALIPKISKYPALNENQLNAMKGYEVKKILDSAGIGHVEFKDKRDETNMLWVYPEVDLLEISFKKANTINPYGNVLDLVDEKGVFVKPASLHFIGTKN